MPFLWVKVLIFQGSSHQTVWEVADKPHVVSGLLLYAKTDETLLPNQTYQMSGNKISVKTLDLDCDFEKIAEQLDEIVDEYFG